MSSDVESPTTTTKISVPKSPPPPIDELSRYKSTTRRAEILRSLPVIFVILLILFIYTIYVAFHCLPLMQLELDPDARNSSMHIRGIIELSLFHFFFAMFAISHILSIVTPPATIPNSDEWLEGETLETKKEGTRRFCKWCQKYKPDRAHHCRQCRRCILKMDHHCPWIYNCVGYGNHKYFVLTLIYSTILTIFVSITQVESVKSALEEPQIRFGVFILLLFSQSLTCLLALICSVFLGFHLWLIINNISTIEFCEKHFRRTSSLNVYNRGCLQNMMDALGHNPLLWCVPIDNRTGDGIQFPVNSETIRVLNSSSSTRYTDRTISKGKPIKKAFTEYSDVGEERPLL